MAGFGESSSAASKDTDEKPVVVRVKRKAVQSLLEAFWLEINERPSKRPLLDFEKLSISDSSRKEELKTKKVFVKHVETVTSSEVTFEVLQSFVPLSSDASNSRANSEQWIRTFKKDNIQEQLLSKARESQEVLAKNARFEQIWKRRKGNKGAMHDEALHEMYHLYDVVRVDVEETSKVVKEQEDMSAEDFVLMSSYLPLVREFIPNAAADIESDIRNYVSKQGHESTDEYVYDYYTVQNDLAVYDEDAYSPFPLVQVDDDDGFYDGPDESEYGTDDSNAEDNPCNDYPDEETSEEEDELESEDTSGDEAEELKTESSSDGSPESKELLHHEHLDDADDPLEVDNCDDAYFDDNFYDDDNYGYDSPNDTENED